MKEIWMAIPNYDGAYEISNLGRVKSLRFNKEKILTQHQNTSHYPAVGLCIDGKATRFLVHRLVADAFIPNVDNLKTINHINEIKTDNSVSNLEWMTLRQNQNYSKNKISTSKYAGVSYSSKNKRKWRVSVSVGGKTKYLGVYADEIDARDRYISFCNENNLK